MKKVTVIIPVYNVQDYLEECLKSVLNQTYKNIEIILIDNSSTDNSGNICDQYAKLYNEIKVFHIDSKGVSNARNYGIKNATGEFLIFIDSDDFIEKNSIEKMIKDIEDFQMCIYGYWEKFKNCDIKHEITKLNKNIDYKKAISMSFERKYYGGYIWNKIFLTKIVRDNNIQFENDIYMCEDLLFIIKYMTKCTKIKLLSDCFYFYRIRKSSMVWNKNDVKFESIFKAYAKIYNILKIEKIPMENYNCALLINIFHHKKLFNNYKKNNNIKINYNKIYYKVLFSKKILLKEKIKLIIIRRFNFIYKFYVNNKIKKLERYN